MTVIMSRDTQGEIEGPGAVLHGPSDDPRTVLPRRAVACHGRDRHVPARSAHGMALSPAHVTNRISAGQRIYSSDSANAEKPIRERDCSELRTAHRGSAPIELRRRPPTDRRFGRGLVRDSVRCSVADRI